jgi:hypothetical protein
LIFLLINNNRPLITLNDEKNTFGVFKLIYASLAQIKGNAVIGLDKKKCLLETQKWLSYFGKQFPL